MAVIPGFLTATWSLPSIVSNNYSYVALGGIPNYVVTTGDFLEYDVFWVSGPGTTTNLLIAMDLIASNGNTLRDTGAVVDQNDLRAHPGVPGLADVAFGKWYSRRITMSALVGSTINNFTIVCESDGPVGNYVGRFRNMRIVNGTTTKVSIYENNTPGTTKAAPSTSVGVAPNPANNGTTLTSLVASPASESDVATEGGWGTKSYGTVSYGSGAPVSSADAPGALPATTSAGRSTTSMSMTVISGAGDMFLVDSEPDAEDITLSTRFGPNSLDMGSGGAASATFALGVNPALVQVINGVSTVDHTTGVAFASRTDSMSGQAKVEPNRLIVILATDAFTVYPSSPPFQSTDVWLAPNQGPSVEDRANTSMVGGFWTGFDMIGGDRQAGVEPPPAGAMFAFTTSRATCSFYMAVAYVVRLVSAGRGSMTARGSQSFSVASTSAGRATVTAYLGSPIRQQATANGVGGTRDQFGGAGRWYLGSSTRMEMVSRGVARPRTLTNTLDSWYLGSTTRIAHTSAGRATVTSRLSSPERIESTSNGKGGVRDQFGTTGRWYLGSSTRMASTSAGKATLTNRLAAPERISSTSAGRATGTSYLSSPIRFASQAHGKGGGVMYAGSRVYFSGTSTGRAGSNVYQGGTFLLPNTTIRGQAQWVFGPNFMYAHVMTGVGLLDENHLAGTQRIALTSRGVGSFRDNDELLRMVSNGSSAKTEFDKPPFAFVVRAGAKGQQVSYRFQHNPLVNFDGYSADVGFTIYMSSRIGLDNNNPRFSHIHVPGTLGNGPSQMTGRSTFSFPYEPISIAHAGCRAFLTYRSDQSPEFRENGNPQPGGVIFRQTSPDYISARTNSDLFWFGQRRAFSAGASVYSYLSSRVYWDETDGMKSRGRSSMVVNRIDEADFNGVGGGDITLGADNRLLLTQSDGVGDWPINYLPDLRSLFTRSNGVAGGRAYQAGTVHFFDRDVLSEGVGTFEIDPGLMVARSNGVGRVLNIQRPDQVYFRWGSGEFFYEYHFPYIAPLLIPNGSNGMSRVEIEERSTGVIHHHMDGVSSARIERLEGVSKVLQSRADAGSLDWFESRPPNPVTGDPGSRRPYLPIFTSPTDPRYHKQGVEAAFPVQPVLIAFEGRTIVTARMGVFYELYWQRFDGRFSGGPGARAYTSNDYGIDENGQVFGLPLGSGRVGGIGRASLKGDRQMVSRASGRASIGIRLDANYRAAANLFARGVSTFLNTIGGGSPPLDRYGNMLRYFFIPIPTYGQVWPRKERQHGQPVQ